MIPVLKVITPGFYSTIQDQGRRGFQHVGVPVSGALDRNGYLLANALVGNTPGAACLEIIGSGPELEVTGSTVRVALVGSGGGLDIGGRDSAVTPSAPISRSKPASMCRFASVADRPIPAPASAVLQDGRCEPATCSTAMPTTPRCAAK